MNKPVKPVKSLWRKFEFKTLSAHKIQIDSFDFGVRSSPYGYIMEFRPSSHLETVYFTKRPAGGGGCQIVTSHPVFFMPTICKLNLIFCRWNKSTCDFVAHLGTSSLTFVVLRLACFRIFAVDLRQVY